MWIRRLLKTVGILFLLFITLLLGFSLYVYQVSDLKSPIVADTTANLLSIKHIDTNLITVGDNWMRKNKYGLYEMYVSGSPYERGVKNGLLSRNQIIKQEEAFTAQIKQMIPSHAYLKFLKYIIGFMNKDLPQYVTPEYQEEILGISHAASDSFQWIGDNYDRLLNYHAAHDIGHALQNLMLVGCTSFGVWDSASYNGGLLLGRNFDFWVGDQFAEEKIVAFYRPDKGHPFMFVTWGGFTGVVSGMNTEGLTVTINAARSDIPWGGAATPVSLVAREIIQYASTIDEAIAIAHKRKMFVSESFLVGSAKDHKAVLVEKTPDTLAVYDPGSDRILCTNHFQSKYFEHQKLNQLQKQNSASVYRYQRLHELVFDQHKMSPEEVASILRNRLGWQNAQIGEGNEKAVNQLIAHHSIIFQPDSLRVWVSTAPWQLGAYVCYDLKKIFALHGLSKDTPVNNELLTIAPDPFIANGLDSFLRFRAQKLAFLQNGILDTGILLANNPYYYDAWRMAGDYAVKKQWKEAAQRFYQKALSLEIATEEERHSIEKKRKALSP